MHVENFRFTGIRCFNDTGPIALSRKCNIFIGQNNSGKSTLLKALLSFQGFPFQTLDFRPEHLSPFVEMVLGDFRQREFAQLPGNNTRKRVTRLYSGPQPYPLGPAAGVDHVGISADTLFQSQSPHNFIVPFLARRKAPTFDQNVSLQVQTKSPARIQIFTAE